MTRPAGGRLLLTLGCAAALVTATRTQDPPTLPGLELVPADHVNVAFLADPLPPLQAVLESEALASAIGNSPLLSAILLRAQLSPRRLGSMLGMTRGYIPRQVLVALPERTLTDLAAVAEAAMQGVHAHALQQTGGDAELASSLWRSCLAGLAGLQAPRLLALVQTRDARTAENWLELAIEQTGRWAGHPGVSIDDGEDSLSVRIRVGELLGAELDRLRALAGVAEAEPDPLASLAALEVRASLRLLEGDRLLLVAGDPEAAATGRRLAVADLGRLWQAPPRPLLFGRWQFPQAQARIQAAYDLWAEHSESPAGEWLWEHLPEGVPLGVLNLMEQVLDAFAEGSAALRVDRGLHVAQEMDVGGEMELPAQAESSTLALVPADAEAFLTSSIVTPDLFFSQLLESLRMELEERLARAQAGQRHAEAETLSYLYYEVLHGRCQGLLDYIHGAESELFEPGLAIVLGNGALVGELAVQDDRERVLARWRPNLRVPDFALIAKPFAPAQGFAFADRLFAEALAAFGVAGDNLGGEEVDLGLGVPTKVYGLQRFPLPSARRLSADGEMVPHCALIEGHMVLSSSVPLTRRILAQAQKPSRFATAAAAEVGRSRIRGEDLTGMLRLAAEWTEALADPAAKDLLDALALPPPTPMQAAGFAAGLRAVGDLLLLLGHIEQSEFWEGRWYRTDTVLRLAR